MISELDTALFNTLKRKISFTLKQNEPGIPESIEEWKGQDIVLFQEDLAKKVNGRLSEKWFYTHLKLQNKRLPRIDMLNMLSQYCGYSGWSDFKNKHSKDLNINLSTKEKKSSSLRIIILLIIVSIGSISYFVLKPEVYNICFIDKDYNTPIVNSKIQVILLIDNESPVYKTCNNEGCIRLKTRSNKIKFVVKAPYYKTDTITRILNKKSKQENMYLHTNDYALMIHYFSSSKIEDWKKRRKQLDKMFADDAQIYQVFEKGNIGMELYNKNEFINKLTTPLRSLKNIEIIETIYTGEKISLLRFYQNSEN